MSKSICPSCGGKNIRFAFSLNPPDWEEFLKNVADNKIILQTRIESLKDSIWECSDCSNNWGEET